MGGGVNFFGGGGGGSGDSGVIFFFRVSPESRVQSSPDFRICHNLSLNHKLNPPDLLSQMEQQIKISKLSGTADLKLMFETFLTPYLQLLA